MSDHYQKVFNALSLPEIYPHSCEIITTIETHISAVFLTGVFAYKFKKPVDFGFLNFTDLEQRKHFCLKELKLNRRTAPEVYLDVLAIEFQNGQYTLTSLEDCQNPIEYVVKMKQFDPNDVLSKYLKRVEFSDQLIQSLVSNIVHLHTHAEIVDDSDPWGNPDIVLKPMTDNFGALKSFEINEHFSQKIQAISEWTAVQSKQLRDKITDRKKQEKVRACHGDLHIDNIAVIEDKALLFDGIEFNEQFRCIDVISDLAFLIVDLMYRKKPDKAMEILSLYLHETQDYQGLKLLPYYMVYRAMVRAKIAVLRAQQCMQHSEEYKRKSKEASDYVDLAIKLTLPQTPKIIIMQGVSGSGKSYFANRLQTLLPSLLISSDRTRKKLFKIDALNRVSDDQKSDLYSSKMNQKTYSALLKHANLAINNGFNVIVDATFLKREHRNPFHQLASKHNLCSYLISLQPDQDWIERAIVSRIKRNDDPSDATIEIMQRQCAMIELPEEDESALIIRPDIQSQNWPYKALKEFLGMAD